MTAGALAGKVAIVTGAASGIGEATAALLAEAGARIAAFDRNEDRVGQWAKEATERGADALPVIVDLADGERLRPAVAEVVERWGQVDVLVNCAGDAGMDAKDHTNFLGIDAGMFDRLMAVNLRAPFLLMQAVAERMIEQGTGGRIVNVTSSSAFRAHSIHHYAASKAGLTSLTRTAAASLGPHGINVNAVAPGLTKTPMTEKWFGDDRAYEEAAASGPLANLLGRASEAGDVAAAILFLCLPESRQVTGQTIHTSAGLIV